MASYASRFLPEGRALVFCGFRGGYFDPPIDLNDIGKLLDMSSAAKITTLSCLGQSPKSKGSAFDLLIFVIVKKCCSMPKEVLPRHLGSAIEEGG